MARRHLGFTLIEAMVTVALVAIIGTLAGPSMSDFIDKRRLMSQTEQIADLIQLARSEAIAHSSSNTTFGAGLRSVSVTVSTGSPWFIGLSNSGATACTGTAGATPCQINQAGSNVSKVVTATECTGCTLTSSGASPLVMQFTLRGIVTGLAADESITLQSPRGKQTRVLVSRIGRITKCSPAGQTPIYPLCS